MEDWTVHISIFRSLLPSDWMLRTVGTELCFGSHRSSKPLIGQRPWERKESQFPTGKPACENLTGLPGW